MPKVCGNPQTVTMISRYTPGSPCNRVTSLEDGRCRRHPRSKQLNTNKPLEETYYSPHSTLENVSPYGVGTVPSCHGGQVRTFHRQCIQNTISCCERIPTYGQGETGNPLWSQEILFVLTGSTLYHLLFGSLTTVPSFQGMLFPHAMPFLISARLQR